MTDATAPADAARYADRLAALGNEARLRIVRLLLAAHPDGLVVGEIQKELGMPGSTLSHHLEKLKHEGLVVVRRQRQYLRYNANTGALRELVGFLYAECCSRAGKRRKPGQAGVSTGGHPSLSRFLPRSGPARGAKRRLRWRTKTSNKR